MGTETQAEAHLRGPAARARPVLGLLALTLAACGDGPRRPASIEELAAETLPSGQRVLLVGIDGATFSIIGPMVEAGRLPTFERLMDEGAHVPLRSISPIRSPSIWTSIATGRSAPVHGIEDFVRADDPDRLVTSNERRVSALWNQVSAFDRRVGFHGWWVTWPAEPVAGWMVSDRLTRSRWSEWLDGSMDQLVTYPPALARELLPLVVDPAAVSIEEIDGLVSLTEDERREFLAAERPLPGDALSVFKFAYCSQRSYERMALEMLEREQPDLAAVFLIANDPICHAFWHWYEPDAFEGVDPAEAERLGALVPAIQEHNDRYLAELLATVDADTNVIVLSDHGFQASGVLPGDGPRADYKTLRAEADRRGVAALGQPGKHHLDGILIARGPAFRRGASAPAHVYDVAPTVLAVLGLPVPADSEGRVLAELLDPAFLAAHPVTEIDSYDRLLPRPEIPLPGEGGEQEIMDRLRALGYVDPNAGADDPDAGSEAPAADGQGE